MNTISANTKISVLIKANPLAIDAIASINPHFKKLQNPFLRKFLAPRVTIAEAAKIGGCTVETMFDKLRPLGFVIYENVESKLSTTDVLQSEQLPFDKQLDVRADIASGNDPFKKIMAAVTNLSVGQVLLLINSFEPIPLIRILNDRGFKTVVVSVSADEIYTYIERTVDSRTIGEAPAPVDGQLFEQKLSIFQNKMQEVDVRHLPMPQPMITILDELERLPNSNALFVHHKKVPLYLLPELQERQYEYVYRYVPNGVELIIYKNGSDGSAT